MLGATLEVDFCSGGELGLGNKIGLSIGGEFGLEDDF
jgi:hypothetical protein